MVNKFIIILVIIILVLSGGLYYLYNNNESLKVDIAVSEQNGHALRDSIRITKNKIGEIEYSKAILVVEKKDLEKVNKELSNELKKERGVINALASTNIRLEGKIKDLTSGVTYLPPTDTEKDSTYRIDWSLYNKFDSNNNRTLAGFTTFRLDRETYLLSNVITKLTKDEINLKLIQGIREVDGVVELFARSNYDGFGVRDVNSVIIDPTKHPILSKFTKKKNNQVGLSLYSGYGMTYNFQEQFATHGFQIGAGVYWRPDLSKIFK